MFKSTQFHIKAKLVKHNDIELYVIYTNQNLSSRVFFTGNPEIRIPYYHFTIAESLLFFELLNCGWLLIAFHEDQISSGHYKLKVQLVSFLNRQYPTQLTDHFYWQSVHAYIVVLQC